MLAIPVEVNGAASPVLRSKTGFQVHLLLACCSSLPSQQFSSSLRELYKILKAFLKRVGYVLATLVELDGAASPVIRFKMGVPWSPISDMLQRLAQSATQLIIAGTLQDPQYILETFLKDPCEGSAYKCNIQLS